MPGGDPRGDIEDLWKEVQREVAEMGMQEPPKCDGPGCASAVPMSVVPTIDSCKAPPPPSETCTSSCKLSGSICKNAQKICTLAQQLVGDSWASQKCEHANKTCDAAHAKCCGCK